MAAPTARELVERLGPHPARAAGIDPSDPGDADRWFVFALLASARDGADAAVPAVPVVDSIRHRAQGALDRSPLVAVQTPQAFVADRLRAAHASGADASDDATLVEADGGSVVVVDGDAANLKITSPLDLQIAELLLGESS